MDKGKLDLGRRSILWIGSLPMRKPMAFMALMFAWMMAWGVFIAAIAGVIFEEHILGFLQAVIIMMLGPIIGYYFSSSYEATRTHHEEGSGGGVDDTQ